jgi:hypothetical protein
MPTSPLDVTVSRFNGVRPAVVESVEVTWEAFVHLTLPRLVETRKSRKLALPGLVLAPVEGERNDANTGAHTALAIDVDSLPADTDLDALLKRAARYTCAVYETPSSTDEAPRLRVIVALREPLAPEAVPAARRALAERLGLDPQACGTAGAIASSQVMFAGRVKGTRERQLWVYEGKVWTPPKVSATASEERDTRKQRSAVRGSPAAPASAATSRRDRTRPKNPPQSRATAPTAIGDGSTERVAVDSSGAFPFDAPPDLSALAKVIPYGVPCDRHALSRALGGWLARRGYYPEAIGEAVRDLISDSGDSMPAERASEAQAAAERVRHGEEAPGWDALTAWAEAHGKGARTLNRLERSCRDPREPVGFDGVWSEWWAENLPAMAERSEARSRARALAAAAEGAPPPEPGAAQDGTGLHLHATTGWPWILQSRDSYWIHSVQERAYRDRQYSSGELISAVSRCLAGMISVDDEATLATLRREWIAPVNHIRATYTARVHTYESQSGTLTLASLRWTARTAKRHAHIDRWLRALFGAVGYDAAAQWIAAVVALDRPAPCLYLPGPKGLGKSLLADGLSALWSRPQPVKMRDAIKDFNQSTGECPLIFTDEGFPEKLDFSEFREMVTQHSRPVNAKFRAPVDVEGCGRFIIAANNEDVLRFQKTGTLTRADLDAIADRLLVITCHPEAAAETKRFDTTKAAQYEIAEHALWLASTVGLEPAGERMAAKPGGGERILASVVAGRSAEILARIREYIAAGNGAGEKGGVHVPKRARESEVWINVQRLYETLDGKVQLAAVKECCESFALRSGSEQWHLKDGGNIKARVLDRTRLDEAFARLD